MPSYFYSDMEVASGYNNTAGLAAWESLTDANGVHFFAPILYGKFNAGQEKFRLDGTPFYSGFAEIEGLFSVITQAQVFFLMTTYCAGGFSGQVTIKFRQYSPTTYVTANAIMHLPQLLDSQKQSQAYKDYKIAFRRIQITG